MHYVTQYLVKWRNFIKKSAAKRGDFGYRVMKQHFRLTPTNGGAFVKFTGTSNAPSWWWYKTDFFIWSLLTVTNWHSLRANPK